MRLIDDQQPVRREVVEQRPRPGSWLSLRQVARIVLDARAIAELPHHLEVEGRSLAKSGALQDPSLRVELADPRLHLRLDVDDRSLELVGRCHVVGRRVDVDFLALREELAGQRIQLRDAFDDVAEEFDPHEGLLGRRLDLEGVAADPKAGTAERLVVALVLEIHEMAQHGVPPVLAAGPQLEHGRAIVDRGAQAVDARDGRDDDDVASLEQGVRGGMAQPIDLVVAARVLLDVRVAPRQICLGLVIVEIADEIFDGVVREEVPELRVQLGGQGLVVGEDKGRAIRRFDDFCQGERLAGACRPEQRLVPLALCDPLTQARDRGRLVTGGLKGRNELEVGHRSPS